MPHIYGESEKQFIVDDCLPTGFDDWKKGRAVASELPEQHYWYVIGDTYYYNTALTAFSYKGKKEFNLTNVDRHIRVCAEANAWKCQDPSRYIKDFKYDIHQEQLAFLGVSYCDIISAILKSIKVSAEAMLDGQQIEGKGK